MTMGCTINIHRYQRFVHPIVEYHVPVYVREVTRLLIHYASDPLV
jgi:hypothetical protein